MRRFRALYLPVLLLLLASLLVVGGPSAARAQSSAAFQGEYYANPDLTGAPAFHLDDPAIRFVWGNASPGPGLPVQGYSVRWTRWYDAGEGGVFGFKLTSDDGSRLWVDSELIVDMWYDHDPITRTAAVDLTPGLHFIKVEYYHRNGNAVVQLDITPAANSGEWLGQFFAPQDLNNPVMTTTTPELNFNWPSGSPDPKVPGARFAARWTRDQYFEAGAYRFTAMMDDGMRVWVDGSLLIDQWRDQAPASFTADTTLTAGIHSLRVDYYNASGNATARLSWAPLSPEGETWTGSYYNNTNLSGNPAVSRKSADLNFRWGTNGPGGGLSGSAFSAKFDSVRSTPASGFYTVYAAADDGVRVSVDDKVLIDEWHDQAPDNHGVTVYLNAGSHKWHVEYYQHLGSASLNVGIVSGVGAPPGDSADEIVVEDGGPGWLAGGDQSAWKTAPNGSGGRASTVPNNAFFLPSYHWGRWYPSLAEARQYEVEAYIPGGLATTRAARYWITHAGVMDAKSISQAAYRNEWVSLGTYYFNAMGGEYVMLPDVTYECAGCYTLVWDAIKFIPR